MGEWKEYKLGELISINAKSIGRNYHNKKIEYLDTGSITKGKIEGFQLFDLEHAPSRAKRLVRDNDIIYSTVRPIQRHYGIVKNPKSNLVVSTGFAVLSCDEKRADAKFVYYFLTSDDVVNYLDIVADGSTSAYPSLTPNVIADMDILIPSLPEQKSIASILSSLDDKIDLLHRQNKTLEALAETLFRQWFVEEAEEGWEEKGLNEIAIFLNGLACQKYPPVAGIESLPVIKIKELRQGITDATDMATSEVPSDYIVKDGDILFSWSGSLELVIWSHGKGVLNQHLFKVSSEYYPEWFFYFWIKYHLPEFRNIARDKATTMGHIQRHHLSDALVVIPDSDKMKYFDAQIKHMFGKIKRNLAQNRTLTRLRDTLLPKLMSGEVRVKDIEEQHNGIGGKGS